MRRHICLLAALSGVLAAQTPPAIDFVRDVQPILREHCYECHGPSQQMRGLRLDRRRDAMPNRVGANRPRIVPGDSARSSLYLRVRDGQMPPAGPLQPEQVAIVKAWIDRGAAWPDEASGERTGGPADPNVVKLADALRDGPRGGFDRILKTSPAAAKAKGHGGWTPLMYAALYGDASAVGLLLNAGADPNAQNEDGGTATMYAVDDPAKVRLLLDRGADPNLRSGEGRTALLIAAAAGHTDSVKLLLDKGADLQYRPPEGRGVLALAAARGDAALLRSLLARGAARTPSPLSVAAGAGCAACVDLLLEGAAPADLGAALQAAVGRGDLPLIQKLLARGAGATPNVLLAAAYSPAVLPADVATALIDRGADRNARTPDGASVLDAARRNGKLELVKILANPDAASPATATAPPRAQPAATVRAAIARAIPPLQRADVAFLDKAGCVSCHNNSLTAMTVSAARGAGLPVDETVAQKQLRRIAAFLRENRERALEDLGLPGGVDTVSYILLGMAAERYPGDAVTDAWARYLRNRQAEDGSWKILTVTRAPLESSDFQVTAASIRALRWFRSESRKADYDRAVARAVRWLEQAQPKSTEDSAFKILGLVWGGGSRAAIREAAGVLLARQRSDGGWAQTDNLPSDAYATGQALVALKNAAVDAAHPAFRRGVRFLLDSQWEDGSWHVPTRALAIQPYFDSEYPHGADQFISAAAANWATMALIAASR